MTAVADPRVDGAPVTRVAARPQGRPLELGLLLLPLAVALTVVRPLGDPDLWWHLRTGALIADTGLVSEDPWSFASSQPWLLHEWASEVAMYAAFALGGYAGVVVLTATTVALFAAVLMTSCRRAAQPALACVAFSLAAVASMTNLGPRPQLVSWLLLALCLPYLRACVGERRLPWLLVPLTWSWANLHGLWLTALVLYGALVLGLAIEEGVRGRAVTARFAGFAALPLLAASLTPSGPALLLAPLHVREYARFVTEWAPPSITNPATACALLLVLVVVVDWARAGAPVPPSTISFVVAATAMGLLYSRTVPVAAIAVAPIAAAAMQRWSGTPRLRLRLDRREAITWCAAVLLVLPLCVVQLSRAAEPEPGQHSGTTTAALTTASERLDRLPGRARVLNQYELGGWLLWAATDTSPAIDGRTEIYGQRYVERYMSALAMGPGWQQFVRDVDVDAALLLRQTPLAGGLQSIGWTVAVERDGLLVLLPPSAAQR